MSNAALDIAQQITYMEDHCLKVGYFDRVNLHEPKNAPARGLTAAIWCERVDPIKRSGLAATSIRLEFDIRVYSNMLQEPVDSIDPNILEATSAVLESLTGNFELGGQANSWVDVLGAHGYWLGAQSGYLGIDHKMYRVMTVRVPIILDNIWEQEA